MSLVPGSQSFTLLFGGLVDKILSDCWIRRYRGEHPAEGIIRSSADMVAGLEKFEALWDTGASHTFISSKVVALCDLKPVGTAEVHARWGAFASECYLVDLWISENIVVRNALVARADNGLDDVIIGMDVIRQGDLALSHVGGRTMLSFRVPSVGGLDLVEEQDRLEGFLR